MPIISMSLLMNLKNLKKNKKLDIMNYRAKYETQYDQHIQYINKYYTGVCNLLGSNYKSVLNIHRFYNI